MTHRPHTALAGLLLAAVVVAAAASAGAPVPAGLLSSKAAAEDDWRALSRAMAAPWPEIQHAAGNLPDYMDGTGVGSYDPGTSFGDAVMGYALLQVGVREGDERVTRAGLRAVDYAVSGASSPDRPSVFEAFGVASAYNLARKRVRGHPDFHRKSWAAWLRKVRTVRLDITNRYGNHWLVDALVVFELLRTGLRSGRGGTVLGGGRARARRQAIRLVNRRIPAFVRGRGPFVLSDPPDNELPYQALSLGLYARLVRVLGSRASRAAQRTLRQIGAASRRLIAPDGDVGYFGRSQGLAWGQSATAYGAGVLGGRFRGLAELAVARLRKSYPVGPAGQYITPGLERSIRAGGRALDRSAGAPSMGGLALVLLNWAIGERRERPRHRVPDPFAARLSQDGGRFAVVRRGDVWYAVKGYTSTNANHQGDLRYDFGLVAMKRRVEGEWRSGMPLRPRTKRRLRESAGPILRRGGVGMPAGRVIPRRDGTITVKGGFRDPSGRFLRRATFRYRTVPCGVRLSFRPRAGDRYELSVFFSSRPAVDGRTLRAGNQSVATSVRGRVTLEGGYASSSDAHVTRARIKFRTASRRPVSLTVCG